MENTDKLTLLKLARESIRSKLEGNNLEINTQEISDALKQKRGTFVTLKTNGQLRGCIGHIAPVQELYRDVMENACAAAFYDPRFMPLAKEELEKIAIEISLLSESEKFEYPSLDSLIQNLERNKPGVILRKGSQAATFLPQVWEELPSAEEFLSHLCLKAGLDPYAWKKKVAIETYTVEKISS